MSLIGSDTSAVSPRRQALSEIANPKKTEKKDKWPMIPISEYFGELTFGLREMRERLPKDAYNNLVKSLELGKKLSKETAESIALVIKEWAVSKGATHFTHWFQPMTGSTAEKHDAFISIQHSNHSELRVIERFTGGQLSQGEPDASSFPSGGMRSTFEARGYTAWDPASPLFLVDGDYGMTLCIPSVFVGYHGQALDQKTPLLRSNQAMSKEVCEFLKLLGDVDIKSVTATLGVEQEYFVIDRRLAALRPDLVMCGRTLIGAGSTRGQQLEDHYFGSIPTRVKSFMEEFEYELFRLGIPIKTRHNEVAPAQYEVAPIFENANIAADHNALMMETMKNVANRHGFMCLLHEKPFGGINGSGKHCNWSISNDKGENLLEPGRTPHQNLRFLAVCAVVMKAVHDHADMLRVSIASAGNDHRLGANEAPPAIISVFLGSILNDIFETIGRGEVLKATESEILDLGVGQIPDISKDYTDRNRTSPFAFTGNKFEFRAVGSAFNVSFPVTILNAAAADAFSIAASRLKEIQAKKGNRDEGVMELIRELVIETKNIRFEGNNYSEEWRTEAKKRGLPILPSTPEALPIMKNEDAVAFLVEQKVLSSAEIESRYHVYVERYVKTLLIELATLRELVVSQVVPATEIQFTRTATTGKLLNTSLVQGSHSERCKRLEKVLGDLLGGLTTLEAAIEHVEAQDSEDKKMKTIFLEAIPAAENLRKAADLAETLVADDLWPLPKYREMLFANTFS